MSAIGDYIHLNVVNYQKYGVSKKNSVEKRPSAAEVYVQQRYKNLERINSIPSVDQATLEILKQRVAFNFPEGKSKAVQELEAIKKANKLSDYFYNFLLSEIPKNAYLTENRKTNIQQFVIQQNSAVSIEEAKRKRKLLYDNIKTLNSQVEKGTVDKYTTPKTILKNLNDFFQALGLAQKSNQVDNVFGITVEELKRLDVRTALEETLRAISFAEVNKATLHGQMGEQTVALCGDVAIGQAMKAANEVIIGGQGTSFSLNESIIPKMVQQEFKQQTGLNLYQVRKTQDKVDVQITVNQKPLNISVKAYTPRHNRIYAHLQDVSLLTSLATTVEHFANHWLNIHSLNLRNNLLDTALLQHMQYEALVSGNLLKQGASIADSFTVIDTEQGRVYTTSTKDILQNKTKTAFIMRPDISTLKINGNVWASTWEQRIANILQSVHKTKISVILNVPMQ